LISGGDRNEKKIDREKIEESRSINPCAYAVAKRDDAGSQCLAGNATVKPVFGCASTELAP
jgi:hypothetical protein